jgi:glycosyltransferase involved in cell wall biosynthesis
VNVLFYNANRSAAFGGIEHWMLDVSAGLAARAHAPLLYGRPGAGWLEEARRRGLDACEGCFGLDLDPRAIAHLRSTLRARSIDVVFTKGKKGTRNTAVAARLLGRGKVVLVLGIEGELSDRAIDRWTWRFAVDRAIVLAEEAKHWYERIPWATDAKLRVVFKGVDVAVLDPRRVDGTAVRGALGIPPDALVIGAIGRLVWQKGHVLLLRAVARLLEDAPHLRLLLAGAGEEEEPLRAEARALGLEDRVVFAGYRRDVPAILAAMDVFALPSRKENMPQVLLEAMAMGRPVVSTATIGVREVLEHGQSGFVVATGDVNALAERLAVLARAPALREQMGARGRERILRGFTREDMLDRIERLMREVCGAGATERAPAGSADRRMAENRRGGFHGDQRRSA